MIPSNGHTNGHAPGWGVLQRIGRLLFTVEAVSDGASGLGEGLRRRGTAVVGPGAALAASSRSAALGARPAAVAAFDADVARTLEKAVAALELSRAESPAILLDAAGALAAWCGDLPASQSDHDAGPGGLLRHSVLSLLRAAPQIAKAPRALSLGPDVAELFSDRVRLAIAIAVLYHDIGKIYSVDVRVDGALWDPAAEPLLNFASRHPAKPSIEWRPGRGDLSDALHHDRMRAPALSRVLPAGVWAALHPISWWLVVATLAEVPRSPGNPEMGIFISLLRDIVAKSDHAAAAAHPPAPRDLPAAAHHSSPPRPPTPISREESRVPAPAGPPVARRAAAELSAEPAPLRSRPLVFSAPKLLGLVPTKVLTAAISKCGANEPQAPIFIGGLWIAIDAASPVYAELIKPQLSALLDGRALAWCDHFRKISSAPPPRCTQHGPEFPVEIAMTPGEAVPVVANKKFVFVSHLALSDPLPDDVPSFTGRLGFPAGAPHPRLSDLRFCIPLDGRDLLKDVACAILNGSLIRDRGWFVLGAGVDRAGSRHLGLAYEQALSPLAASPADVGGDSSKVHNNRLHQLWDRIFRLRLHLQPNPGRTAITVSLLQEKLGLFIFTASASKGILDHVEPQA